VDLEGFQQLAADALGSGKSAFSGHLQPAELATGSEEYATYRELSAPVRAASKVLALDAHSC
jgi:hypothetical protein